MKKSNKIIAVSLISLIGISGAVFIGMKDYSPSLVSKEFKDEVTDITGDQYSENEMNTLTEEELERIKEEIIRMDIPENILTENIEKKVQYPGEDALNLKKILIQYSSSGKYREAIDQILKINETYKFTSPNNVCITNMFADLSKLQAVKDAGLSTVDPNIMRTFRDPELCALASLYFSPEIIISGVKDRNSYIPIMTTKVNFIDSEVQDLKNADEITQKILLREGIKNVVKVNLEIETIPVVAYVVVQAENSNVYVYGYYPEDLENLEGFPYKTVEYWDEIQKSFGVKLY